MSDKRECPFCDKVAEVTTEPEKITYKGVEYTITQYYYKCPGCGEEFMDDELTTKSLAQIPGYIKNT